MHESARSRRSLRTRATGWVALIALVVGALGAVAFVVVLRQSLQDGVRAAAEQTSSSTADRIEEAGPTVVRDVDDDVLVQLQTSAGAVVERNEDAGESRLPADDGSVIVREGERWLVVSDDVDTRGLDDAVLVVGAPLTDSDEAVAAVRRLLLVVVPLLVVAVAALTWVIVGRALRPVEQMRLTTEAVRASNLDGRVAEPGGGDELDRLAQTLNGMLARLEAARAAQRQFVSDASHELRSPLATVRQHAELARLHPDRTSLAELSEVVLFEGARQQDLVESLLVLSRLDEAAPIAQTAVDLDDVVLAQTSRVRGLGRVEVDSSRVAPARATGDQRLLSIAVRNLVDNAARHADRALVVSLTSSPGHRTLTIDDDGAGVPVSERERIFDRFVRLDEGRDRDSGGSGLGLSIVQAVVLAHHGTVRVDTSPAGGARFVVDLPAERTPAA